MPQNEQMQSVADAFEAAYAKESAADAAVHQASDGQGKGRAPAVVTDDGMWRKRHPLVPGLLDTALIRSLYVLYRKPFLTAGGLRFINTSVQFLPAILVQRLLRYACCGWDVVVATTLIGVVAGTAAAAVPDIKQLEFSTCAARCHGTSTPGAGATDPLLHLLARGGRYVDLRLLTNRWVLSLGTWWSGQSYAVNAHAHLTWRNACSLPASRSDGTRKGFSSLVLPPGARVR